MPWGGGAFTRTNGTFTGATVWQTDEANNIDILSDRADIHDQDIAEGISACLNKDGQNAMAANLAMGGNKVTGMDDGTDNTDGATKGQVDAAIVDRVPDGGNNGDVLTWTGANWVSGTVPGGNLPIGVTGDSTLRWNGSAWVETDTVLAGQNSGFALGPLAIASSTGAKGTISSPNEYVWIGGTSTNTGLIVDTNTSARVVLRSAQRGSPTTSNNRLHLQGTELRLNTSDAEAMRINSSRRILVGGEFTQNQTRFRIKGQSGDASIFQALQISNGDSIIDARPDGLYSTTAGKDTTGSGSPAVFNLGVAGWKFQRQTSSIRYKENVEDLNFGLSAVMSLRPVEYTQISEQKRYAGMIAEEVEEAGLGLFVLYDGEGRPDGLQYTNMVALLVKAVQELTARVEALEAS